jgi:shikimate kinase/3-dehydroquinate synthase
MTASNGNGDRPVVILCGFMGAGKSSVGAALAPLLGVELIDTDALIEEQAGTTIAAIFSEHGEEYFRGLEAAMCRSIDASRGAVIATGGGMVMDPDNFSHLEKMGTTVWLEASVDAIVERAAGDRPLLVGAVSKDEVRARVVSLLAGREDVYRQCELRLETSNRTSEEAAYDIREMVQAHRAGFEVGPLRLETRPLPGRRQRIGNTRLSRVAVGRGVADGLGAWLERLELTTSVFFFTPPHIGRFALPRMTPSLDEHGVSWRVIHVDDGDAHKNLNQGGRLIDELAVTGAARDSVVVTTGGGVTSDLGGFVASIYMRGLPLVHVPTSLLAQVDASIGGKVGVNHARAKNLIGAVYQPHLVLIDPSLLDTLPEREWANGMAEVIKTAIIDSPELFEQVERMVSEGGARRAEEVITECVRLKAGVVEDDPFEVDRRRILNLGHTLGHALESALTFTGPRHGEAVGLGLLAAWRVAIARGCADAEWLSRTRSLLEACGLPTQVPRVDERAVRAALVLDKKRRDGGLTYVLPLRPGCVEVVDDVTEDELLAAIGD